MSFEIFCSKYIIDIWDILPKVFGNLKIKEFNWRKKMSFSSWLCHWFQYWVTAWRLPENFLKIMRLYWILRSSSLTQMSHLMTKPTKWHVCPAKTQISLGICSVWSESSLSAWRKLGSFTTRWAHSLGSDQADLSLRWAHSHFVGFVMRQIKFGDVFPWGYSKDINHN